MEPNQNQQLDPSVVALTKSIGQAETGGNYNAPTGKAGETGAYQMTPTFIENAAPKYLKGYTKGSSLSPSQQDELAYNVIKEWGTEDKLTPAQVASKWNSGKSDAYLDPEYGKNNNYGSVENYVNKVSENYNSLTGQNTKEQTQANTTNPTTNSSDNSFLSNLEGGFGYLAGKVGEFLSPTPNKIKAGLAGLATGAVIGGIPGALEGAATGYGEGAITDVANSMTPNSENTTGNNVQPADTQNIVQSNKGIITPPKAQVLTPLPQEHIDNSNKVYKTIADQLKGSAGNRNYLQSPAGNGAVKTAATFGLVDTDSEGNINFNNDKREKIEGKVENAKDSIIGSQEYQNSTNSFGNIANMGNQFINSDYQTTNSAKEEASKVMKKEMLADFGNVEDVSLSELRKAQKTHYAAAKNAYKESMGALTPKVLAHKALGAVYGKAIREKINPEDSEIYDRLTKMSQDLTNVKSLEKRVRGKKATLNKSTTKGLLETAGKYAAIYIGDKIGGPVGAILGDLIGEKIQKKINKKFGKNDFETPAMRTAMSILSVEEPKTYEFLDKAMEHYGIKMKNATTYKPTEMEKLIKNKKAPSLFKEGTKLDTVMEKLHKKEILNNKNKANKKSTSDVSHNPKYKKGLLSRKLKEKVRSKLNQL